MAPQSDSKTRLDSWKAVSVYFGCDERTVRRWEAERGLPIRRLPGGKRSHVYAEVSELEAWLRGAGRGAAPAPAEAAQPPVALPAQSAGAVRRRPAPLAAQELFVEGLRAWTARTPASLNHALDAFNAALRIDPDYAEALAGLANTFILLREYTLMPDAQAYPLARDAARRALAVNANLPEAHAALAFVHYWGFWDAAAAAREFELTISLDPEWANGHHWYATFLDARGEVQQALREIERALQIDPASLAVRADRGLLLYHAGRPDEAVAELQAVAAADPSLGSPHRYLATMHLIAGRDRDYLGEARLMAELTDDRAELAAQRAAEAAYEAAGRAGMLSTLLADRIDRARSGTAAAFSVAWLSALCGDQAAALAWLQKSLDRREGEFVQVVFEPVLSCLADCPEFQALLAQVAPF